MGGVGVVMDGVAGVRQGASDRLRDLGSSAGGVAVRAAEGVSSMTGAATDTTGATRRALRSTRQGGRNVRLEARRRITGMAHAARGDRPAARWPMALGALGVGVGIGLAAGVAAGRSMHDDGTRAEDPPEQANPAKLNGSSVNGSAETAKLPDMERQRPR